MTKKCFFRILFVVIALLLSPLPALAQGDVYVDTNRTPVGNEDGTQANPYDTMGEGEAYAQSLDDGGYLYVRQPDGTWKMIRFVSPVDSGGYGTPFPRVTLYILLAILAVGLVLVGWRLLWQANQGQRDAKLWPKS